MSINFSSEPDGCGFIYQRTHNCGFEQYNIAVPGRGYGPHPGPGFKVLYGGVEIGEAATLDEAKTIANAHWQKIQN
jgi:hypothetical protein